MSETVHYKGKLTKLVSGTTPIEVKAKEILQKSGEKEMPSYYNTWTEFLVDNFFEQYVVANNTLFEVEKQDVGEEDVFHAVPTEKGYNFEVQYYNGGCSFNEAIKEALDSAHVLD